MAEAEQIADRIGILLNGRLVTTGTPLEITATGASLTKVSVRTEKDSLAREDVAFPAVQRMHRKDEYHIFFSTNRGRHHPGCEQPGRSPDRSTGGAALA